MGSRDQRKPGLRGEETQAAINERKESIIYQVKGVLSGRLLPEQGNSLGVINESC